MRKSQKALKYFGISVLSVCVLTLGVIRVYTVNQHKEHEEMVKIVKNHESLINAGVIDAFKSYNPKVKVKKIRIDYDRLEQSPMGGIEIVGYINENPNNEFSLNMNKTNIIGDDPDKLEIANSAVIMK